MNTNIKTSGITLSSSISEYVTKRLEKISKIMEHDTTAKCDVELGKVTGHQKGDIFRAEIHLTGVGRNCYASSEQSDLYAAIDIVRDEIFRELMAVKGKKLSLVRRSGMRVKGMIKGLWPFGVK